MRRLAWATDIHLNFIGEDHLVRFCRTIALAEPDALLISGDIAEAHTVEDYLRSLENLLQLPIYFVLGNHDYYRGSIPQVRGRMRRFSEESRCCRWLPAVGVVELTPQTALVGHDGWADGRLGDYARSQVVLSDYLLIKELALSSETDAALFGGEAVSEVAEVSGDEIADFFTTRGMLGPLARLKRLHALGDEAAAYFRDLLPRAFEHYEHVMLLTHVPPFKEACWHAGRISDDDWLPHFTCAAVGDELKRVMQARAHRRLTVLCGHTHTSGVARILPNLLVRTGGATYRAPELQPLLTVD